MMSVFAAAGSVGFFLAQPSLESHSGQPMVNFWHADGH